MIDVIWHLANFLAPAASVGVIASLLAKLFWRRRLAGVAWWRLCRWASATSALALVGGLVASGRDGSMATYAVMVLGCGVALWWIGSGRGRR